MRILLIGFTERFTGAAANSQASKDNETRVPPKKRLLIDRRSEIAENEVTGYHNNT